MVSSIDPIDSTQSIQQIQPVEDVTAASNNDDLSRIFSFRTNDEANTSDIYLGVSVFYKIYDRFPVYTPY